MVMICTSFGCSSPLMTPRGRRRPRRLLLYQGWSIVKPLDRPARHVLDLDLRDDVVLVALRDDRPHDLNLGFTSERRRDCPAGEDRRELRRGHRGLGRRAQSERAPMLVPGTPTRTAMTAMTGAAPKDTRDS